MHDDQKWIAFAALAMLAACNGREPERSAQPQPSAQPSATPTASILRPEVEPPVREAEPLERLELVVTFPDGGSELDPEAITALKELMRSEQVTSGWMIELHGHSDAGGSDEINRSVSRQRAEAVRAWLISQGVAEDRIAPIVAFGEQNPAKPNALPGGEPDEAGRAANRRVEIAVTPPAPRRGERASAVRGEQP